MMTIYCHRSHRRLRDDNLGATGEDEVGIVTIENDGFKCTFPMMIRPDIALEHNYISGISMPDVPCSARSSTNRY